MNAFVTSAVPTMARTPLVGYRLVVVALVATGFFSFGLWVHHMFTTGIPALSLGFFSAASMAVAIGYAHFGHGLLAKNGGWEYPLVLALVSLFFVTAGAGPVSVDARFSRREREHRQAHRYRHGRVSSYA